MNSSEFGIKCTMKYVQKHFLQKHWRNVPSKLWREHFANVLSTA